ncbi:MAG TPA: Ig-like domain-containing protein [Firmicutes bacterium]|nr:Ig-like domain-containing protein [Bacillota bacterium]
MKRSKKMITVAVICILALMCAVATACGGGDGTSLPVYAVTIVQSEHGSLTADKTQVEEGGMVTFTAQPADCYVLSSLTVNGESVSVSENEYTLYDVRGDVTASAQFAPADIVVRFYDGAGTLLFQREAPSGTTVEYVGSTPEKALDEVHYYVFEGWYDAPENGTKIEDFTFTQSADLYAYFTAMPYTAQLNTSSLSLKPLETAALAVQTDLPEQLRAVKWSTSDPAVAEVSSDGVITAIGGGEATVSAVLGGRDLACTVTVQSNASGMRANYVYGTGYVNYRGDVGTIYSAQANITDADGEEVRYAYVDYSVDIAIDAETTGNFGLQAHKAVGSGGNVLSAYQFNFETTLSDNVCLKRSGITVSGTTCTYPLEVGNVYNFRMVTSPAQEGFTRVACYIDGNRVIDATVQDVDASGTLCGLRLAAMVSNRFANIVIKDNTPVYSVTVQPSQGGTVSATESVVHGQPLTVTLAAETGYEFSTLTVNGENVTAQVDDGMYTIPEVTEDLMISAAFVRLYAVTVVPSQYGAIIADKTEVRAGGSVVLTIVPDSGYRLQSLCVNEEPVPVSLSQYTVENVSSDLNITATFELIPETQVSVSFYVDRVLLATVTAEKGSAVTPPAATKADSGMTKYTFREWQMQDGTPVTEFVFEEDISLYAAFDESKYSIRFDVLSCELYALDEITLTASTDNPAGAEYTWSTTNAKAAEVHNGAVLAVGTGTAEITAEADGVTATCSITVKTAEGYTLQNVLNGGAASYENGVLTLGEKNTSGTGGRGTQSDVFYEGEKIDYVYLDMEINWHIGSSIGTGANAGIQFAKTETSSGSVSTGYQLSFMTSDLVATNNVVLKRNGAQIAGDNTTATVRLEAGKTYRFRIVTAASEDGGMDIKVYIDGELCISYTDETPLSGTCTGIRCANMIDWDNLHKVALVSVKDNSPNTDGSSGE